MVKRFSNSQNCGKPSQDGLVCVVQGGISRVMSGGFRLTVVIAHEAGDDGPFAAFQSANITVHRQVFAVLVMAAMADHVPGIVKQSPGFQEHARLWRQAMYWLQLVKQ